MNHLACPTTSAPLALVLLAALLFGACAPDEERAPPPGTPAGAEPLQEAPDFTLETPEGELFTLTQHQGEVVILNFWATWCAPCVVEVPEFVELQDELEDQDVLFVGVSQDTGPGAFDDVRDFREMFDVNYPLLMDTQLRVGTMYNITSLPTTLVIDRSGRIHAQQVGLLSRRQMLSMMGELIEYPTSAGAAHLLRQPGFNGAPPPIEDPLALAPSEAVRLVDEGAMVVDLRPGKDRQAAGVIPIALEVEVDALDRTVLPANLGAPVVFVASDEAEAWTAASRAAAWGYVRAHPLAGGWAAWVDAGLPVEPAHVRRPQVQ